MKDKKFRISLTCEICRTTEDKEIQFEENIEGKLYVCETFNCNRCYAHGLTAYIEEI